MSALAVSRNGDRPPGFLEDRGMRRFWLRSLLAPASAWRWRAFILRLHRDLAAPAPDSRILSKPLHGYVRRGWSFGARTRALLDHYGWCKMLIKSEFLSALCAGEAFALARLAGRRNSHFRVILSASAMLQTQREGEITISLVRDGDPTHLSRLTLAFVTEAGRLAFAIGGLQGPKPGHKREVIDATRDLFGLRPKDATLLAAQALADAFGAPVHAVSDANHVHRRLRVDPKHSSYDAYWRERGGAEEGSFGFVLPALEACAATAAPRDRIKNALVAETREFARFCLLDRPRTGRKAPLAPARARGFVPMPAPAIMLAR